MKKSAYTEQQIAFALKQTETGTRVDEVCRKMGISDAFSQSSVAPAHDRYYGIWIRLMSDYSLPRPVAVKFW